MNENNHEDAQKRSNVESFEMQHGWDQTSGPQFSGDGHLGENIITFVVLFAIFIAGLYTIGLYPDAGWVWWLISIVLMVVSWGVVFHVLPSKTNGEKRTTGTELTMK